MLSHDQQVGFGTNLCLHLSMNHLSHDVSVEVSSWVDLTLVFIWGCAISLAVEAFAIRANTAVFSQNLSRD